MFNSTLFQGSGKREREFGRLEIEEDDDEEIEKERDGGVVQVASFERKKQVTPSPFGFFIKGQEGRFSMGTTEEVRPSPISVIGLLQTPTLPPENDGSGEAEMNVVMR